LAARITARFKRSPNRPSERLHMTPLRGRWQIRWQVGIGGRSGARQPRDVHDLRRGREPPPPEGLVQAWLKRAIGKDGIIT